MYDANMMQDTAGLHEPRWATMLKGVVLVLFGVTAIAWPGPTVYVVALLFAAYILVAGVMDVVSGVRSFGKGYWYLKLLIGILEIAVGVYLIERPTITLSLLVLLIGLSFLVRGVIEGVFAFDRDLDSGLRGLLAIGAVFSVIVGFVMLRYPLQGGIAFLWVLAIYALIAGPINIALALREH